MCKTGVKYIVGQDIFGGVIKFVSERNGTVFGVDSRVDGGSMEVSGCGACTIMQVSVYETGVKSIVSQDIFGGLRKVVLDRNGTVVGFDSRGNRGSMDVPGRGTCTVGQAGVYKTELNSIIGQDLCGGVHKVVLDRNGTVVGVDSRGDGGSIDVLGRGTCTVGQAGVYKTGFNSIVGQDICDGVHKFSSHMARIGSTSGKSE